MKSGGSLGGSSERGEIGNEIVELGIGKLLFVVGGHGRTLFMDYGLEFGFRPGMVFFAVVHELEGEGILVEDDAGELGSLPGGDGDEFVVGGVDAEVGGDETFGDARVGIANGLDGVAVGTPGA